MLIGAVLTTVLLIGPLVWLSEPIHPVCVFGVRDLLEVRLSSREGRINAQATRTPNIGPGA